MDRSDVAAWLDRYVAAWRSYDRDAIGDLFSEDATYRYHPYDEPPVVGRDAIVDSWLEDEDEPGSFEARYEPYAVEDDRAVALGTSTYASGDVYDNVFTLRFDGDGRCSEFTEWFMKHP